MQLKGKKIFILSTIIVYCASFLLQSGFSLLQTRAQETNIPRVNVVAVLVDDKIYNQISDDLERYTKNYVQQQLFDTKALVMPLNLDNISAYDIYRMMENIYFDGLENVNSSLIGLIMVGNIPLPVVNQNGYVFPTVYPYVDFENQKYVRDSDSNYFVPNGNAGGQAEIWHGLIDYGDDIQAYSDFFQKVKSYSQNPDGFIGDSMWYEDFIANKEGFVDEYFQYYKNKIMFGEDLSYQRYSPLMSKIMGNYSLDTSVDILTNIQNTAGVVFSGMDSETINSLKSQGDSVHTTKIVQQEVQDSYLADYNELFSKIGLSRMRENIFAGGRWIKNSTDSYGQKIQVANADNSSSMIQLKDTLYLGTDNFQGLIENLNELMENMVDKKVEDEKYSMDIVMPVELEIRTGRKAYVKCFTFVNRFENYYFGRDARYINDPKDLSIYRGTYRNLKSLDGVTYNSLLNGYNPPISQNDDTNFRLRSIGASYDIFSTQVEGNRGFNSFLVSDDLDEFDDNKERSLEEEKTNCIQGLCTVRRKSWPSNCGKREDKCEDIYEFATRWWGGASAINVESGSFSNGTYRLSGYRATNSWRPIFDMGGFRALLPGNESTQGWTVGSLIGPQKAATSFEAYRKYSSPTERDGWQPRTWGYIIYNNHMPDQHLPFASLDYWTLPLDVLYGGTRLNLSGWNLYPSSESDKMFTVYGRSFDGCGSSRKYTYKFLSSVIKHDSTSDLEINGVDYEKYGENGEIGKNNTKIIRAYQSVLSSITGTLQDYGNIIDTLSGNKQIMQSWSGITPDEINGALSEMNTIADYSKSVLSDLYAGLNSLVLDEIVGSYDGIISDLGGDIEYYSGSYSGGLPKIPLLPDWISGITGTASSIRTNGLNLINRYNVAIQSIQSQISLWDVYANNWKVYASDELVDSISNKFNNNIFIIHIPEEEVTADMTSDQLKEFNKLSSGEKAELLTIDFTTVANSYNTDFLNSYTEIGNIFSNLKKEDVAGLAIITGALTDLNFMHWLSDNSIQIDTYAELITTYAKWSIDNGIDGTRFSNHQDMLDGVIIHEDGMNLLTNDRPIDSPRYISMQSIAGNEINLIYPNLFKVEVFGQSGQNNGLAVHNLLTKSQIKENLVRYLSGKADEYNTILMTEYNNASSSIYYQRLSGFNVMATPNKNVRPYNYFTYDEFVDALGGTGMLDVIVDILYYQNLTNTKKLSSDSISKDIDLIKKSFNINDKRAEVLKDYLTQGNEQSKNIALVIPTYQISGYEVAYVNSNGKDYIISDEGDSSVKVVSTSNSSNSDENGNNPANNQNQDECNIPLDGVLPLIKLDGTSPSSPWYQGVKCWLKNLDVKVKITFDSSVGVIFDRGITGFLSDTFAEPFTSWRSNAESWGNEVKESYSNQQITEMQMDAENHNQSVVDGSDGISNAFATFSANVKISSSNLTLSDNNPVSELKISSITDIGNVTVVFSSTGDGCLKVDDDSLCSGNLVSRTFNPKTNPSIFYISSADHIAGSVALDLKFQLGGDYIEKVYKYKVSPSDLDVVYINAGSDKTVAGMATPIEIVGYDKYNNRVSRGLTNYDFVVSTGELSKDGVYQTGFTTNDFRDLKFYYRAPAGAVNNSEALIQIKRSKNATGYLATHRQTIVQGFPEISLDGSVVLSNNAIRTGKAIRLTSNENVYNDLGKLDVSKLHSMVINVKSLAGNIIDVNSEIKVTSKGGLIVLGQVYKNADGEDSFYQTSKSYMSGGIATVYYYPTTVAGDDVITINIPGLENRIIDLSVLPSTWVNTQILLENDVLNLGDTMDVEILLSDKWGNLVDGPHTLPLLYDSEQLEFIVDGVVVEPVTSSSNGLATVYSAGSGSSGSGSLSGDNNGIFSIGGGLGIKGLKGGVNFDVNNGYSKVQVHGVGAGLSYIAGGNSYAEVTIDKHLFPTSGLNIMYLNYFGDDWGNQWGYFSNNNKYIEGLMKDSNKIITTTTQLISEEKIKRIVWKIDPGFRIWNPDNTSTLMILKDGEFNIKIGGITNMVSDLPSLNWMSLNESTMESILGNSNSSQNNYVFFISNGDNYSISEGVLYSGDESVGNILDGEISLQLTQNTLYGDNVWSVLDNGVNYGSLVFHYPSFVPDGGEFSIPGYRYTINSTFTNGSTASMLSIGIFDSQSSFELDSSYTSIQDSVNTDESIGFQGNFKNITLFAEGEIVGEATRKFGSEFVINLGDPVLSRKSNNENVYGTNYDGGLGQEIYSDSENDISSTHEIDFNNDGLKDLLVVYLDGSIKLAKNYGATPNLRNMQEIMRIAIPIKDVYVGDVDGNNYEDIILRTQNNQIRVYLNHDGIFDVDGNVACLNLNVYEGEVSNTPSDLSGLFQFFIEDMDMDNILDFVTYDYKGYIKVFYGGTTNGYSNYLSTEKYACDTGWYDRQISNTKIVAAFGANVTSERVYDDSMIRRVGMVKPEITVSESELSDFGVTIDTGSLESKIKAKNRDQDASISSAVDEIVNKFDVNKASEQYVTKALKYQEVSLYENELVGGSGHIYPFVPISYLTPDSVEDKAAVWKNYSVKNGGSILADGDIVTVTVTIQARQAFVGSFGDIIQGPWKLYFDDDNIFKGIEFVSNKKNAEVKKKDGNFAYLIDNISLNAGETMVFKYDLEYAATPLRKMDISYKTFWSDDDLPDIKMQPVDGCAKDFDAFVNSGSREFEKQTILLQDMIDSVYEDMENDVENPSEQVSQVGSDVTSIPGIVPNSIHRESLLGGAMPFDGGLNGADIVNSLLSDGGISLNLDVSLLDGVAEKVTNAIDDLAKGMCNGFSFGGSNNCKGLPVPFNQAFLAPGKYNLFGCIDLPLGKLEGGLPVFFFPGTLNVGPYTVPFPYGLTMPGEDEGDGFLWAQGGVYPSFIRIYAAPTLTLQLGVAICLFPYATSITLPSPIGDMGGNCIVFAIKPQCKKKETQDPDNPIETFTRIVPEVSDSGPCQLSQKGPMVTKRGYRSSAIDLYSYSVGSSNSSTPSFNSGRPLSNWANGFASNRSSFSAGETMGTVTPNGNGGVNNGPEFDVDYLGIISLETNASVGYFDESGEPNSMSAKNSIMIGNVDILGGDFSINKIRGGIQQGLRKAIIDKWLDPQIRYIVNQLTKMHITVKLPNFDSLISSEKAAWRSIVNDFGSMMKDDLNEVKKYASDMANSGKKQSGDTFSKWSERTSNSMRDFNASISNPFESLASLMNQSEIFNISTETLTVKVPMIYPEDIASYGVYLQQWADSNMQIIEDWRSAIEAFGASCAKEPNQTKKEKCYEDAERALASLVEFESGDWEKMLNQIYVDLQILQEYRNFPFEMYERIHVLDRYMSEIISLISNTVGYLSYRMVANEERFVGYVDAIILIIDIIKTYQMIIDFSIERGQSCGNCAEDTYDQYSCKLSILCDLIQIPVIQIPNFKIPNITLDLSNIDLGLNIILPKFNFQPIKIELPEIPNLPEPPSVGIDIKLFDLPDIPQLPEPPDLPELPSFIPQIEIELPMLPPAPELPKIPNTIEVAITTAKYIGKIYCIVKSSFGLVGEKSTKAKIEQITERTYEVKWIDTIMNFTNLMEAPIKNYGVDYEISSYVNLQFNFNDFYNFMDTVTKQINNLSTAVQSGFQYASNKMQDLSNGAQGMIDGVDGVNVNVNANVNTNLGYIGETSDDIDYVDYANAKGRLNEVLAYFKKETDNSRFEDTFNSSIKKIEKQVNTPAKIEANLAGIQTVENEVIDYLKDKNTEYSQLADLINDDYEGFLAMVDNQNKYDTITGGETEKLLTFNVQLFNMDGSTKETLINLKDQNPYVDLLDNKKEIVDGYWNAIITNTPDSLGLSQSQYLVLRDNIGSMKKQVATMYSLVRPVQSTSLLTKDTSTAVQKTMVAANGGSVGGSAEAGIAVDPQAFTQGIYEEITSGTGAGERLVKVVYSDSFAESIGKKYYATNHLQNHDIILRTDNAVYKKCMNQSCTDGGNHFNGYYMHYIENIPYEETWISFDSDTKLKIADKNVEVKNFKVDGQTYDDLTFSWMLDDVDAYLIKLVERVDYSYEKADYTDNSVRVRYVLAVPKGIDLGTLYKNNIKLELLNNRIDEVKNLYSGDLVEVVDYDVHKLGDVTISNIERKWYYIRIAALELNGDTYNITSPWSNQIVAGRQIVGDDLAPTGKAELYRPSTSEVVSEGNDLKGYVGTRYTLNVNWDDNVALSYINISKDGNILTEKYTSEMEDVVSVDISMHTQETDEIYYSVGIDQFGNKTEKVITLSYDVPGISVIDVSEDSDGETASVIAEISQDVDQGSVSFQRRRGNVRKTMKRKDAEFSDIAVGPRETIVKGGPYTIGNDIAMYDKNDEVMALMNPKTAEIKIQSGYQDFVDVKVIVQNSAVLQLYNRKTDNIVFSIALPMEKLMKIEADGFSVKDLPDDAGMGIFNGGKAVYKDGENVLFISPTGHLYSELGLEGTYDYDRELQTIVLTVYQLSDLHKKNPIKVRLRVQPFVAL